jgi:hypothetical protein
MGKTSVWLSADLDARWRASGLPLSELVRRGLERDDDRDRAADWEALLRHVIREEMAALPLAADRAPGRAPSRYAADGYASEPYEADP